MAISEIERLVQLLARVPGLGPRSARRAVLQLMKRRDTLMLPLGQALLETAEQVRACSQCGNLDTRDPCGICRDREREDAALCVVEDVGDLWALERTGAFRGRYHVLGGTLSALDGRGPEDLGIDRLVARVREKGIEEVILALSATVDGQTTAHYIAERLTGSGAEASGSGAAGTAPGGGGVAITRLAHGVPLGGELDYLDDGTLTAALRARRPA